VIIYVFIPSIVVDSLPICLREDVRRARERIEEYEEECSRLGMMVTEHASSVEEQRERIQRMEGEHEGVVDALRAEVMSAPALVIFLCILIFSLSLPCGCHPFAR